MLTTVQDLSLLIIIAILTGIFFGAFLIYADSFSTRKKDLKMANAFLWSSWASVPVFVGTYFFADEKRLYKKWSKFARDQIRKPQLGHINLTRR